MESNASQTMWSTPEPALLPVDTDKDQACIAPTSNSSENLNIFTVKSSDENLKMPLDPSHDPLIISPMKQPLLYAHNEGQEFNDDDFKYIAESLAPRVTSMIDSTEKKLDQLLLSTRKYEENHLYHDGFQGAEVVEEEEKERSFVTDSTINNEDEDDMGDELNRLAECEELLRTELETSRNVEEFSQILSDDDASEPPNNAEEKEILGQFYDIDENKKRFFTDVTTTIVNNDDSGMDTELNHFDLEDVDRQLRAGLELSNEYFPSKTSVGNDEDGSEQFLVNEDQQRSLITDCLDDIGDEKLKGLDASTDEMKAELDHLEDAEQYLRDELEMNTEEFERLMCENDEHGGESSQTKKVEARHKLRSGTIENIAGKKNEWHKKWSDRIISFSSHVIKAVLEIITLPEKIFIFISRRGPLLEQNVLLV